MSSRYLRGFLLSALVSLSALAHAQPTPLVKRLLPKQVGSVVTPSVPSVVPSVSHGTPSLTFTTLASVPSGVMSTALSASPTVLEPLPEPWLEENLNTQDVFELSLQQVLASCEKGFPLLSAARQERMIALGERVSTEGAFDPKWTTKSLFDVFGYYQSVNVDSMVTIPTEFWGMTFFAGYRYGVGAYPPYEGKYETGRFGELRAGLVVPLWRNGPIDSRRANIQVARISERIADLSVEQARIDMIRSATHRYWNWVEAGKNVRVAYDVLKLAELRDGALAERVQRGDLAASERLDNQRAVLSRQSQVIAMVRRFQNTALELSLYYRNSQNLPVVPSLSRVPKMFPEPVPLTLNTMEQEVSSALRRRPDVRRMAFQIEQVTIDLRNANNRRDVAIDLTASVAKDLGEGSYTYARNKPELELGLVIDIPILNRAATGKRDSALAKLDRFQDQMQFLKERIGTDIRNALIAELAARNSIQIIRKEKALAFSLEALERQAFALGNSTLLVVNIREQASSDVLFRENKVLADYHRAVADFKAVTVRQ